MKNGECILNWNSHLKIGLFSNFQLFHLASTQTGKKSVKRTEHPTNMQEFNENSIVSIYFISAIINFFLSTCHETTKFHKKQTFPKFEHTKLHKVPKL